MILPALVEEYFEIVEPTDKGKLEEISEITKSENINNATMINWVDQLKKSDKVLSRKNKSKLLSIQKKAVKDLSSQDVSTEIETIYSKIIDLENAKQNLLHAGRLASQEKEKNPDDIEECTKEAANIIEKFYNRIYNKVNETYTKLKDAISSFNSQIRKKGKKIIQNIKEKFKEIMNLFYKIITDFISFVFGFIDKINLITKRHNFRISTFELKFDSPEVENTIVLGIPIPIVKLKLPTLTISFVDKSKQSTRN